jgi:exopolyphosphatase/guanosine-5'-triphosphate,3'-diphosphate pyrophosphatase
LFAAVDLGSNSFHLLIARAEDGCLLPFERVKEKVQLARGQRDGVLTPQAIARGLACLGRFGQRLHSIEPGNIRVVGTSALREAVNGQPFLNEAARLVGAPAQILSGEAEAELIFLGVSHALAAEPGNWLVIDVGGGSTEFCYGGAFKLESALSIRLGCVGLSDQFFEDLPLSPAAFRAAHAEALALLAPVRRRFAGQPRVRVVGTSGTMESVCSVLSANGYSNGIMTRAGLERLKQDVLDRRWVAEMGVPGLAPERVDIFPAGLAAVCAIFEALDLDTLEYVDASLQDGLLYDLIGRRSPEDVRELSVGDWQRRFRVDLAQAARVERTALVLFDAIAVDWSLGGHQRALLRWACGLHEIGLAVSARQPNRHGAYLVENGDLTGFSHADRRATALLIRGCRGAFPMFAYTAVAAADARILQRTALLLRLALILERSRTDTDSPALAVRADADAIDVTLPPRWLNDHPLSRDELQRERDRIAQVGVQMAFSDR